MMSDLPESRIPQLGRLILVRLLDTAKTPPTRSKFDKDLKPYLGAALSKSQWQDVLSRALADLEQRGLIETRPFRLTESGRGSAIAFLGMETAPAAKWTMLRDRYLIARALGISPTDKPALRDVGTSKGLRPAVLVHHYDLPGSPVPSESRVKHLLAWKQLQQAHDIDVPPAQDISHNALLRATILRGQKGDPVTLLAAQVTNADSASLRHVREAVIRCWLERSRQSGPAEESVTDRNRHPAGAAERHSEQHETFPATNLIEFAGTVLDLARTSPTGWFGENKVFVSHVWNRFRDAKSTNGVTRADFDRWLVECNRQGLLALSRADLVSAMNPEDVEASEIRLPNSSFHFIRTDR